MSIKKHLEAILYKEDPDYFKKLSDEEKKSFTPFLINQYLSNDPDLVTIIADYDLAFHEGAKKISKDVLFLLYYELIPKRTSIPKKKPTSKRTQQAGKLLRSKFEIPQGKTNKYLQKIEQLYVKRFEVSTKEARESIYILLNIKNGEKDIIKLFKDYGVILKGIYEI